ncbi:hypothetical protein F5888DRAFT_1738900 [Russula emetica]|nr:hypothetical protein F5888DRAFT_1738900 [Russula emetica]
MASTVFATPFVLSSTLCVTFRFCAATIRASSCVKLSSLFSASSISVRPISFFAYFFIRPCFISFVAIPRIERTSTII